MGIFRRIFKKPKREVNKIEIVSRKPVGRFRVLQVFNIFGKQVLAGEVIDGIIYPGYKLKGRDVGIVRNIEKNRKKVDFAVSGDVVALMLENKMDVNDGELLEVYQS
ncbi:tRNA-binding protein Pbp11 [Thermococcus barophilus]|uniref:Elongation factor Tu-type domain-containing protein n=1 Tax=Thermococcus barophilus (strain DSM 11836 / MP) TaxID=391623 RepID=F0LH88_THEBM|nr:tRNA-binding protein Pbp11 [Thermococcus barophilus]ADT83050.1 hypothetical protein TERMP_00072 [Thermococcus barophilus MP]